MGAKDNDEDSGFQHIKIGPISLTRWTKESIVEALVWGKPKPRLRGRGTFTIWSIGIAGYNIAITKTRTR